MKRVIREGIFETNSSSTHAVSVKQKKAGEPWRKEEDIPYSEKEIRSPYEKMLFTWGIVCADFYDFLLFAREEENMEDRIREETERHETLKKILLEECAKHADFDREDTLAEMDESTEKGYAHCLCCRYFNEDTLDECTCGLSLSELCRSVGAPYPLDAKDLRDFAEKLFDPGIYFVTKEGFYGGYWDIEQKIF